MTMKLTCNVQRLVMVGKEPNTLFCRNSCLLVHLTLVLHLYVHISLCTHFGFCVLDGIVCNVVNPLRESRFSYIL